MPRFQNPAYTVVGVVGSIATSVAAAPAGRPLVIADHATPALTLRNRPNPVAPKRRAGVPGVTASRLKRVPTNVDAPRVVHVAPPSTDFRTPAP